MSAPVVIEPGGGEVVGDSPDRRVELLSDHDSLHATWSRFGPGREGADLHVHHRHTDLFYVLEGELTLRLGVADEPVSVPAGSLVRMPPNVVHGFRNAGDAELRFLNLHVPGQGFAAFMRALRDGREASYDQHDPSDDGGRPVSEAAIGGDPLAVTERDGVREALLAEIDAIAVYEVSCAPGAATAADRAGRGELTSIYVVEGEVVLTAGDDVRRLRAGSWAQAPSGAALTFATAGDGPARFLRLQS
jgi:quercetin dioxygenase-like cupin family protein